MIQQYAKVMRGHSLKRRALFFSTVQHPHRVVVFRAVGYLSRLVDDRLKKRRSGQLHPPQARVVSLCGDTRINEQSINQTNRTQQTRREQKRM